MENHKPITAEDLLGMELKVKAARMGLVNTIQCPSCGSWNNWDMETAPCCNTFVEACMAVCDRLDVNEAHEVFEMISENLSAGKLSAQPIN